MFPFTENNSDFVTFTNVFTVMNFSSGRITGLWTGPFKKAKVLGSVKKQWPFICEYVLGQLDDFPVGSQLGESPRRGSEF